MIPRMSWLNVLRRRLAAWRERFLATYGPPAPTNIRTERLLIRELEEQDVPALLDYRSRPEVSRYQPGVMLTSDQEAWWTIHAARSELWRQPRYSYDLGVVLEGEARLIGECHLALMSHADEASAPDAAAVGFIIHPEYWGRGYATEAARALVRFAFTALELATVYGGCLPENAASCRVLEKAGLVLQGTELGFPGSPEGMESLVFCLDRASWEAIETESCHDQAEPQHGCGR